MFRGKGFRGGGVFEFRAFGSMGFPAVGVYGSGLNLTGVLGSQDPRKGFEVLVWGLHA